MSRVEADVIITREPKRLLKPESIYGRDPKYAEIIENLSDLEIDGMWEYEDMMNGRRNMHNNSPKVEEPTVMFVGKEPTRQKFVPRTGLVRSGRSELTRLPHKHLNCEDKVSKGRKKTRKMAFHIPARFRKAPALEQLVDQEF